MCGWQWRRKPSGENRKERFLQSMCFMTRHRCPNATFAWFKAFSFTLSPVSMALLQASMFMKRIAIVSTFPQVDRTGLLHPILSKSTANGDFGSLIPFPPLNEAHHDPSNLAETPSPTYMRRLSHPPIRIGSTGLLMIGPMMAGLPHASQLSSSVDMAKTGPLPITRQAKRNFTTCLTGIACAGYLLPMQSSSGVP